MNFLPYEQFTLLTSLDKAEVMRSLSQVIRPMPQQIRDMWNLPYFGMMTANGFQAAANPLRQIYRPHLTGQVTAGTEQTTITITISADPLISFAMASVLGIPGLVLLTGIAQKVSDGAGTSQPDLLNLITFFLIVLGIIAITFLLYVGLLKVHARRAHRLFTRLLEAYDA